MSTKLKSRVKKMNFQRQGNDRRIELIGKDSPNFEEAKYYDNIYSNKTEKLFRRKIDESV